MKKPKSSSNFSRGSGQIVSDGEGVRFYKWSLEGIFWERASAEEVKRFDESEKGKKGQKIPASVLLDLFTESDSEWMLRSDLIETLTDRGYARATAHRAVKPLEGYQRHNLEYRPKGKGKILEVRWNGVPIINPKWKQKRPSSH